MAKIICINELDRRLEKVLIVKLSSMGDLVQALPALTDAVKVYPRLTFDWVVDELFSDIPHWHPAVAEVFPLPLRHWKAESRKALVSGVSGWRRQMKAKRYDAVIDLQGNFKSSIFGRVVKGDHHGYDSSSIREWGAHLTYSERHPVDKAEHAIRRMRTLMAASLKYPMPDGDADFGLVEMKWPKIPLELPQNPFLVFVANASWPTKSWLQKGWRELLQLANDGGYEVLLPWGSEAEHQQAQEIAKGIENARVLPGLSLTHIASILEQSSGAVCVDTGLAHISAALGNPTVTLYGPTDPVLIGATGSSSTHVTASAYECIPCYRKICQVDAYEGPEARCLGGLSAGSIWQALQETIAGSTNVLMHFK